MRHPVPMRSFLYIGSDVVDVPSLDDVADQVHGLSVLVARHRRPTDRRPALSPPVVDDAKDAEWLTDFGHLPLFQWTDKRLRVRVPVYEGRARLGGPRPARRRPPRHVPSRCPGRLHRRPRAQRARQEPAHRSWRRWSCVLEDMLGDVPTRAGRPAQGDVRPERGHPRQAVEGPDAGPVGRPTTRPGGPRRARHLRRRRPRLRRPAVAAAGDADGRPTRPAGPRLACHVDGPAGRGAAGRRHARHRDLRVDGDDPPGPGHQLARPSCRSCSCRSPSSPASSA